MSTQSSSQEMTPANSKTSAESLRRAARGSALNLGGAMVAALSTFVGTIAITRGLSVDHAGVFFSTSSLFLLATAVGQLGTDTGLVYFLSRARVLKTPQLIPSYMKAARNPVLVTALVMAVGLYVFAPELAKLTNSGHQELAKSYIQVFAIFIPFAGIENVSLSATRGLGTMKANAAVEQILRPLLQLVLVVIIVALSMTELIALSWAFAYLPAALAAWWWWRRLRRPVVGQDFLVPLESRAREFWKFAAPRSVASVVQLAMQRFDIVLVGALSSASHAAIYAAATRFIVVGQMSRNAVSLAVQPQLAESLANRGRSATNHLYQASTAWLVCVTWPIYLTLAVAGGPLLNIFGKGYNSGVTVLLLLSVAMLIATACGDVDVMLIMAGRTSWSLANVSLAFTINLGLDLWLIPSHGVTGAAIGWAVAIATKNLSALIQVAWVLKLHPFGGMMYTSMLLCAACFALVPGGIRLISGSSWQTLIVGLALGGILYLLGLVTFRRSLELGALLKLRRRSRATRSSSTPS